MRTVQPEGPGDNAGSIHSRVADGRITIWWHRQRDRGHILSCPGHRGLRATSGQNLHASRKTNWVSLLDNPGKSRKIPETPGNSRKLPETPGNSRNSRKLPETPGNSWKLPKPSTLVPQMLWAGLGHNLTDRNVRASRHSHEVCNKSCRNLPDSTSKSSSPSQHVVAAGVVGCLRPQPYPFLRKSDSRWLQAASRNMVVGNRMRHQGQ